MPSTAWLFDWRTDDTFKFLSACRHLGFLATLFIVHPIFLRQFVHDTNLDISNIYTIHPTLDSSILCQKARANRFFGSGSECLVPSRKSLGEARAIVAIISHIYETVDKSWPFVKLREYARRYVYVEVEYDLHTYIYVNSINDWSYIRISIYSVSWKILVRRRSAFIPAANKFLFFWITGYSYFVTILLPILLVEKKTFILGDGYR